MPCACGNVFKMASSFEPRQNLFRNCKPFCEDPVLGGRDSRVPSLFLLSVHAVLRRDIPCERVPSVLRKTLETYKYYEQWREPRIMKCSACSKFYTTQKKFDEHKCKSTDNIGT